MARSTYAARIDEFVRPHFFGILLFFFFLGPALGQCSVPVEPPRRCEILGSPGTCSITFPTVPADALIVFMCSSMRTNGNANGNGQLNPIDLSASTTSGTLSTPSEVSPANVVDSVFQTYSVTSAGSWTLNLPVDV